MVAAVRRATSDVDISADGVSRARTGSWVLPAPAGAHTGLLAWPSGAAWFDAVLDTLTSTEGENERRRAKVARDTLLRVAYADRKSADQATGRGVATAHETVALQLGMSAKTVQRSRQLLERLGLAVTVVEGRYLTAAERQQAHQAHGGTQLRAASTRALVMPATPPVHTASANPPAVENVYLPGSPSGEQVSHVEKYSPTRALTRTREATAPRRPATTKRPGPVELPRPRPLAVQQLAAQLVGRLPWLDRGGKHIGHVCGLLVRAQLVERGWTLQQILDRLNLHARESGIRVADPTEQRNPLSYLAWLIRRAIPDDEIAPQALTAAARDLRQLEARNRAAADAARRAAIADQAEEIQAIIDTMHQQFPRRPKAPMSR
ncbi:biotin operon repressor [Microbacterium trichothecenolyticum]|uniref:hypothetical protein n=1 Tax=Microbacterium trichothecenolyticum TaxID=69370 RepID=UPI00285AE8A6|nr:hypothetical protein [Microbacterium trichothecenolyticum]MDR7184612.1 biotin operon repressor [Microbacterium trichothecenolyticum]